MRAGILVILLIGFTQLMGQGKVVFQKTTHDFGKLLESDGPAEVAFYFVNKGDSAIQITDVKASCGCTTPFWTVEPVLAGDTGLVTVKYTVTNRPGPFSKSVQVVANGEPESQVLEISGHVTPLPKSNEKELPVRFGALRMKHRSLNMGKITTEKVAVKLFDIYNESDSIILFDSVLVFAPEHLLVYFEPDHLPPKSMGSLVVEYDPNGKNALGYHVDELSIRTSVKLETMLEMRVTATVEEFFPKLTEDELALAPRLSVTDKILNKGSITEGDTLLAEFVLKNTGKETLLIRDVQPNCECLIVNLEEMKIEPNKEAKLEIAFVTAGRKGKQYKNVTIFSNDPTASARTVTIRADVKEVN